MIIWNCSSGLINNRIVSQLWMCSNASPYQPGIGHDWDHQVPSRLVPNMRNSLNSLCQTTWLHVCPWRQITRAVQDLINNNRKFVCWPRVVIFEQVSLYLIAALALHLHPSYSGCRTWILGEAFSPGHNGPSCQVALYLKWFVCQFCFWSLIKCTGSRYLCMQRSFDSIGHLSNLSTIRISSLPPISSSLLFWAYTSHSRDWIQMVRCKLYTSVLTDPSRFRIRIRIIRPKAQNTQRSFYHRCIVIERQSHWHPHHDDGRCYTLARSMLSAETE